MTDLYDPIRKIWVADRPEERVRLSLLEEMVALGYPPHLISVEVSLGQMAHIVERVPSRRIDLVVFGKGIHPDHALYPLLTIECKAQALSRAAWEQVVGYNHYLGAYFLGIASARGVRIGSHLFEEAIDWLPAYTELLKRAPRQAKE